MLVQEPLLGETLYSKDMHETTNEEDETLSLCDLALYSNDQSAELEEDLSSLDQSHVSNSLSSSEHDYFEFFSQELNPSTTTFTDFSQENIVFCGKLIPYKQPATYRKDFSCPVESQKQANNNKKRPKNGTKCTTLMHRKVYDTSKLGKGHGFPLHKMSILTSSSSSGKAKWYLFLFGISRFSTEVELRNMKSRQSRRQCPPPPPPPFFRFEKWDIDEVGGGRNRGWGLWGLIRALSCGGNHQSTTTSMGCTPPE